MNRLDSSCFSFIIKRYDRFSAAAWIAFRCGLSVSDGSLNVIFTPSSITGTLLSTVSTFRRNSFVSGK